MTTQRMFFVVAQGECPRCHGAQEIKSGTSYNVYTGKNEANYVACPQCEGHGECEVRIPLDVALAEIGLNNRVGQQAIDQHAMAQRMAEMAQQIETMQLQIRMLQLRAANADAAAEEAEEDAANDRLRDALNRIREVS